MTTPVARALPADFSTDDRRAYEEIAHRARTEAVNTYTVLCLGLQAYLTANAVGGARDS